MNSVQILLLIGCVTVIVFNALSSIASRRLNFNYGLLFPVSFAIYAAIGFFGNKLSDQSNGVIVATAVGFFEATVGWKISMVLKANTGKTPNNPSVLQWISTAVFVTLLAAVCGYVGTVIFKFLR